MPFRATGEQLAAITRELVRISTQGYGRGATEAKSYQCDNFIFCAMRGGLTSIELNLIEHGDTELVRTLRLRYQAHNANAFTDTVERILGRRVETYDSQVVFNPDYTVEIFVIGDELPPVEEECSIR